MRIYVEPGARGDTQSHTRRVVIGHEWPLRTRHEVQVRNDHKGARNIISVGITYVPENLRVWNQDFWDVVGEVVQDQMMATWPHRHVYAIDEECLIVVQRFVIEEFSLKIWRYIPRA